MVYSNTSSQMVGENKLEHYWLNWKRRRMKVLFVQFWVAECVNGGLKEGEKG